MASRSEDDAAEREAPRGDRVSEEDVLRRWLGLELGRVNQGTVAQPAPLSDLLRSKEPRLATRGGTLHEFDAAVLRRLADAVPLHQHHTLRLPMTVYEPSDLPGDGYVEEAGVVEALQAIVPSLRPRDGKAWMSMARWRKLAAEWPGCLQVLRI